MTVGIGIDPGEKYSAAVLVDADGNAVNGFTLGPTDTDGLIDQMAHSDLDPDDEPIVAARYARRFVSHLKTLYLEGTDLTTAHDGQVLIAVEKITRPQPRRRREIPDRCWLFPWTVMHYVFCTFDGVYAVPCKGRNHGLRHQKSRGGDGNIRAYYPAGLQKQRPGGWGVNEHYRGSREHERAAFDVFVRARRLHDAAQRAVEAGVS